MLYWKRFLKNILATMHIIKIRLVKFKDMYGENGTGLFSLYARLDLGFQQ